MTQRTTSIARSRPRAALLLALTAAAATACRSGPSEAAPVSSPERDIFVATYVELRATAVRNASGKLDPEERREILARHGVTEESLLAFAREHGEDVSFMRAVWDEVETRLDSLRLSESERDIPH
jgi:hypothetical protein